jgi:hypothetical protein
MFKFKNIIVSDSTSVDKDTGNLSLFNIFNNISAPAFPVVLNRIVITVILEREQSDKLDGSAEFIVKQNDKIDFNQIIPFLFKGNTYGTNVIVKLNNYIIREPGKVEFIVKYDSETIINSITVTPIGIKI